MSSSRNPSGETVTEKLLGSHQDEEEYLNPYTSSTELKSLKRWRVLAIVSTGLLLASLIYNIFQPHSRFGNGHIPYIYCMFNANIPFCCTISRIEHLLPSPSRKCHQLRDKSLPQQLQRRPNTLSRTTNRCRRHSMGRSLQR
jgi:hypothetical protein